MKKLTMEELCEQFPAVYSFLENHDMVRLPEQRYELGDNAYVNVESYNTYSYEDRKYESHIRYVDIQYIVCGKENIIVESIKNLAIVEAYDEKRDIVFYSNAIRGKDNFLSSNEMVLLEPEDGHMPCITIDESSYVKKAVFKIPVNIM